MIVRTFGRRKNPSNDDAVSDVSLSQESTHHLYNFSSQDSVFDSDPYALDYSMDHEELSILPSRKRGDFGDVNGEFRKKPKKKARVSNSAASTLDSSKELNELPILPSRNRGDHGDKNGALCKNSKNLGPYNLDSSQEHDELSMLPPRPPRNQLSGGDFRDVNRAFRKKPKKGDKVKNGILNKEVSVEMTTLMETQEGGEMMEHVDEVNFALDGLRKGQPARIRRSSLLSLLSICSTPQQRRLLRTHGMEKTIIDAVLSLSFDDESSNLAAAALFYVFCSDNQDDHLLDTPSCIRFLLKLLNPATCEYSKNKSLTIGNKLLSLRKDDGVLKDTDKAIDSTSAAITLKVEEILVNCKQMKSSDGNDISMRRPELSPKWIALLIMEKASLTTIALEDTIFGTIRKGGNRFTKRLRELGGLNAVFEVARNCHSIMEDSSPGSKDSGDINSLVVLLKCLKIMENSTFLSKDNQCHLLEMKGNLNDLGSPRNFVKFILSITKLLSGLYLSISSSSSQDGDDHASEIPLLLGPKEDSDEVIFLNSSSTECLSSQKSISLSQNSRWLSCGSETSSSTAKPSTSYDIATNSGLGKRFKIAEDPFAFDEDEFEQSKWDLIYGEPIVSENKNKEVMCNDLENKGQSVMILSQQESSNRESHHSDASCSSLFDEEKSNLFADCLLAAIKVLVNLTNENPKGCRQIGSSGGLENLSSLIARHFPSFTSSLPSLSEREGYSLSYKSSLEVDNQGCSHLSDQESDLLVAILGLLINLVEKDDENRYRLSAASVALPSTVRRAEERRSGVIPLLCAIFLIFLTKQGAGEETAGDGEALSWDDEEAVLLGETEAEKTIVESYTALLLAFLSRESKGTRSAIAKCLPNHKLSVLVPALERFVEFHLTLKVISAEIHTTVLEVIESCRRD